MICMLLFEDDLILVCSIKVTRSCPLKAISEKEISSKKEASKPVSAREFEKDLSKKDLHLISAREFEKEIDENS
ncbi:hypothetical protein AXF42_Ash006872 [Apostasia shenzhenica]|uniref:Uncharacterized protein n=1 Tax=Apostasia shenzhenica TaxID=1088818 RepID=A0A2I0AJF2_9ASPA|nr:hypothetical protein AXF42_Ash006872 [Apostasia shenzhenica]